MRHFDTCLNMKRTSNPITEGWVCEKKKLLNEILYAYILAMDFTLGILGVSLKLTEVGSPDSG